MMTVVSAHPASSKWWWKGAMRNSRLLDVRKIAICSTTDRPSRSTTRTGRSRYRFTNLTTGSSHSFGGEFLELVQNERIRHTDKFDDPGLPGQIVTTISLKKVSVGTELTIVQEGITNVKVEDIVVSLPATNRLSTSGR